jgi:predicted negative regulator of RcsB-dependent stress response
VDRLTRHQLKQDEFRDTLEQFEEYFKRHYKGILNATIIVVVVVGLAAGLKYYTDRQEAQASADLGMALQTFRAYVGQPTPGATDLGGSSFPTAQDKYRKALVQFQAIVNKYKMIPRPKAVEIARYQAGVCQALLEDHAAAIQTLQEASQGRDQEIASLAKFALAGELLKTGKVQEAAKLYQELVDHPTLSVPRASALLALADAYRASQPAQARQIYERVEKEFASNAAVSQAVKQQIASLAP